MSEVETAATGTTIDPTDKIICLIDNEPCHSISLHIKRNHPEWTLEKYKTEFPDQPLLSAYGRDLAKKAKKRKGASEKAVTAVEGGRKAFLNEVFELGVSKAAMSAVGKPIEITVLPKNAPEADPYMVDIDPNYVFNIDLLKKIIMAFELGMNAYLWGYHGTGKTTALQQIAARTHRPFVRVQHTAMTEESHILGQYTVRDGATIFELGPLPLAMMNGWIYCADEYDFAQPSVTAVYQPVLEGQNLVIKEAPEELRVIKPHPNFRFVATGNTNGVGDETGLYQGTLIQNAANYSRFHITEEVKYMEPRIEEQIIVGQAKIDKATAKKFVQFAKKVRDSFAEGKIGMTISPRELINGARLGICFGAKWSMGLQLAFTNRLSRVDKKVCEEMAQRIFDQ